MSASAAIRTWGRLLSADCNLAVRPLLACAIALLLGATAGHSQWLETKITLPDSLGGAVYPSCLTTDTSERYVYISDASGFVYVVDAATRTRVAKIPCRAYAVCTDTRLNKVYAADCVGNQVFAISCATNQVVATMPTGAYPFALCYNSVDDKVYTANCDSNNLTVIDCSSDRVLKTIEIGESPIQLCYNPASNRLFCTAALRPEQANELLVIDGADDSVVAVHRDTWFYPMLAAAAVNKVYASAHTGLKILDGTTGAVLDSINFNTAPMCFDSRIKKLYTLFSGEVRIFDCSADTQIGSPIRLGYDRVSSMACETTTGRVYASCETSWGQDVMVVVDGNGDTIIARIAGPYRGELVASSKWRCMYSTDLNGPELAVYDTGTDSLLRTIMLGDNGNVAAMCYDSTDDKIYYVTSTVLGEVGAIDASTNQPVAHVQVGRYPVSIVWHAPTGRVYCGGSTDITVIDPTADTVTKVLPMRCHMLCSAPGLNKVYFVSRDSSGDIELAVIDCKKDSVVKTIPLSTDYVRSMWDISASDYDKLYLSVHGAVIVVDCITDTIVRSYPTGYNYIAADCEGKRVYCATMDSLCTFDPAGDSIVASVPWDAYGLGGTLLYIPDVDKVYCTCWAGGQNCILVADGATDSLIAQIPLPSPQMLCYDAASKLVFVGCQPTDDSMIVFIDSRTDSVVGSLNSQVNPAVFTLAPPHHRMYVHPFSGSILSSSMPVIRMDPPGVEEAAQSIALEKPAIPAIVSTSTPFVVHQPSVLLDVVGRKVLDLKPGANDMRALAPAVYFIREQPQAPSHKPQAVWKVVVTR